MKIIIHLKNNIIKIYNDIYWIHVTIDEVQFQDDADVYIYEKDEIEKIQIL